jgi:hypothetical protein
MSAVGPITVDILRGVPSLIRPRVETWEVPGLDGYGAMTLGQGDSEFEILTITYFADNADADTHIVDCTTAQGTVVTIVDDFGSSFDGMLITHVDVTRAKMPVIKDGNHNAMRVQIGWRMVANK